MQFNSKGKLARFYMWFEQDGAELPQDFCTYFWGLVGRAFFVFIMGGGTLAAVVYGIVTGVIWLSKVVWAHKIQTLFILGFILVMGLTVWLSEREKKIKIEFLSEVKAVIKGKVDAVKKRYCPRIEWK